MDVEKCNCGAIEMEVAENQYFDEAIHHRGTARCIPLTDVADYAQLTALRDERDRAAQVLRTAFKGTTREILDKSEMYWLGQGASKEDFDYLRQLIESEEGQ